MSSVRLALAFLLLFSAGYLVGSNHPGTLLNNAIHYAANHRLWRPDLLRQVLAIILGLSASYGLLLLLGEHLASLEATRARPCSPTRETLSATEYLRRRGSF